MLTYGSRAYKTIDYKATSIISGLNYQDPIKTIGNTIIIRKDLVNYAYEFLSYKIGLTENNVDIAVVWYHDEWECPHNKIFGRTLQDDVNCFVGVMKKINNTFDKASTFKVEY